MGRMQMKSASERAAAAEKELRAASNTEAAQALELQQLQGRAAELERDAAAARQLRERVQDLETQVGAAARLFPHPSTYLFTRQRYLEECCMLSAVRTCKSMAAEGILYWKCENGIREKKVEPHNVGGLFIKPCIGQDACITRFK